MAAEIGGDRRERGEGRGKREPSGVIEHTAGTLNLSSSVSFDCVLSTPSPTFIPPIASFTWLHYHNTAADRPAHTHTTDPFIRNRLSETATTIGGRQ